MWSIWDHQDYFRTINDCYCSFDQSSVALYSKKIVNQANINDESDALIGIYNSDDSLTEVSLISRGFIDQDTINISHLKLYPKKHQIIFYTILVYYL